MCAVFVLRKLRTEDLTFIKVYSQFRMNWEMEMRLLARVASSKIRHLNVRKRRMCKLTASNNRDLTRMEPHCI
jgi:hypothetical protein